MPNVFVAPTYRNADNADGGIRRVSEALWKYLPQFGWQPTVNPYEADLLNLHGASVFNVQGVPSVASCHGLYWDDYKWANWAHDTNRQVVEVLVRAKAITSPSDWVTGAVRRGMLAPVTTIYHGIDPTEWTPGKNAGYVLWNKARSDAVSNPEDMNALAERVKGVRFVSTIGRPGLNVELTGIVPVERMKELVRNAGVYLATARETFGIGTLEALACGVPVVGWDYGGQHEIIIPGETGYLAPYGDYDALAGCVHRALQERARLSENCIADVSARWLWPGKIERYAGIFTRVMGNATGARPKVSAVVVCHNLGAYLSDALDSVLAQSFPDWECVIVDDASTDNSPNIAAEYVAKDARVLYIKTPSNLKLSGSRNFGFTHTRGKYVIYLDADDMLAPETFATLAQALDRNESLHIAYGHLDTVNEQGEDRKRGDWPMAVFDWHGQMAHLNQLPYAAMMRREVLEWSGGYRRRCWRAEDADFWIRTTSYGLRASKVTDESLLIYRWRTNSKSMQESREHPDRDGDWTAWYPWRLAGTPKEGVDLRKKGARTTPKLTPWAAQGDLPDGTKFWPVKHHAAPVVSVIIPVGPGHDKYVIDAVESVRAQTYADWEVIVVNDSGERWADGFLSPLAGAPYARVIETERVGAGGARNAGVSVARGQTLVFLDADDYILPRFLELCVNEWKRTGRLVYTDWLRPSETPNQPLEIMECDDWVCSGWNEKDELVGVLDRMQHGVTCLIPKEHFEHAGGFDPSMRGWEEWDLFIRLEQVGLCSVRIPNPLFVYRTEAGARRKWSQDNNDTLRKLLYTKHERYYTGEVNMACGSCPGGVTSQEPPPMVREDEAPPKDAVYMEYAGANVGTFAIAAVGGENLTAVYRFGNNEGHRRKWVRTVDVEKLLNYSEQGRQVFIPVTQPRPANVSPVAMVKAETPPPPLPTMSEFMGREKQPIALPSGVKMVDGPATRGDDEPVPVAGRQDFLHPELEDDELTHTPDLQPLPEKKKRARR